MSRFAPEAPYRHGTAARVGVLLINLGTPEAPTTPAVRRYLREFLSDPRVVEIPRPVWWVILNAFVLTTRPRASAHRYAQVWMREGSPLKVHTGRQAKLLQGYLGERGQPALLVDYAMRYGAPSIPAKIDAMKAAGCDRILLLPLYPQYAASTTATAFDSAFAALARMRNQPEIRAVRHFHDHEGYIRSTVQNIRDYWTRNGKPDTLVLSFHGVPRFALDRGDPYHCECHKTARLVTEQLQLKAGEFEVTFQSRFGRTEWLKPYTADVLADLGRAGRGRVDVVCPGFTSDCLETLEEIAIEAKTIFLQAGGGEFHYIPCLNERDDWIHALADLVLQHVQGWNTDTSHETLEMSRLRATAMGAKE